MECSKAVISFNHIFQEVDSLDREITNDSRQIRFKFMLLNNGLCAKTVAIMIQLP